MGLSRFRFGESPFPHSVTCTVVGWLSVFTRPETVQILLDSWQFLQDQDRLTPLGYVHWRYASARNYARIEALISVSTDW